MLDSKNMITISGNLVADLEVINDKIVKGSIGVANGGTQDNKSDSGFFDFVYFLNDENRNAGFVKSQMASGGMSKGSPITLIGRLVQERFVTKEGQKASKVKVYAENIDYYGFKKNNDADKTATDAVHVAPVPDGW
jgi:single-stranded DNA-binding protein